MSGGHWDYDQFRAQELLNNVSTDANVIKRFPKLANIMKDLSGLIGCTIHDLDWDISGDKSIEDDEKFERDFIASLGRIIEKKYKIKIYQIEQG